MSVLKPNFPKKPTFELFFKLLSSVKNKSGDFFQIFVAFSEYINLNKVFPKLGNIDQCVIAPASVHCENCKYGLLSSFFCLPPTY